MRMIHHSASVHLYESVSFSLERAPALNPANVDVDRLKVLRLLFDAIRAVMETFNSIAPGDLYGLTSDMQ